MARHLAVRPQAAHFEHHEAAEEPFLPVQLAEAAAVTGELIDKGLVLRGLERLPDSQTGRDGRLEPEAEALARAYEAALVAGFSPQELQTLRRLLTRLIAAARRLSGGAD